MARLEHYPIEKLKAEVLRIVGKHLDLNTYRVFLFGSRVTGTGDEHSDIDIGIEGPAPVPWEIMGKIKEEIENMDILYSIDVVDFSTVGDDFKSVAKQSIEVISPRI